MSEYIIELTDDELNMIIATHGVEDCQLFGYKLTGEIVRCRDCEHFNEYHGKCHGQSGVIIDDYSTRRFEDSGDILVLVDAEPDGFCKRGVRKENHAG